MDIKSEIDKRVLEIEEILKKYLPREEGYQHVIMEAMNYSFLSGGKRLRPMLMLETYRMFHGDSAVIEPFMAAIEMIHTYSLIHDDLPAMDDDEYRRGRKTAHVVFGEAMGILAGDALLNYAFETMANACADRKLCSGETQISNAVSAMQILAAKSGIYGMLGGQVVDVQNEADTIKDEKMLETIYRLKTGALLEASMMAGAALAGASVAQLKIVEQAAGKAGFAFQIQDDILDVTGTMEELGKPIGSDEKNKKTTYVSMYGEQAAKQQVSRLTKEALDALETLPVENKFLFELLKYLVGRRK